MNLRKSVCVIVDAYSTANKLPGVIGAYGLPCIHVQSDRFIPDVLMRSFHPRDFAEQLVFDGEFEALCGAISAQGRQIRCVIAGSESGVILADRLAERFQVPGNGTEGSPARRDKHAMAEALKANSLAHIRHLKARSLPEIYEWTRSNRLDLIVMKPLSSSGTQGFHVCSTDADIKSAFESLHGSRDVFGKLIREVLVQEYVEGEEYAVNIVSCAGRHYVTETWKTVRRRNGHSKVCDLETLVGNDSAVFGVLQSYAEQVLAALKITHGPSHLEIFIREDGTPVLIEAAARFMGSLDLSLITMSYGTNAVLLTAEAHLQSENFLRRLERPRPALARRPAMVQLISKQDGILKAYDLDKLRALKTFHGVDLYMAPGDRLRKTVDSYSSPGLVFLLGESADDVASDHESIRKMEDAGEICVVDESRQEAAVCP